MVLPSISGFSQIPLFRESCPVPPPAGPFALDQPRLSWDRLDALALEKGPALVLPEALGDCFSQTGVLISSALCGGTFFQRVQEAAARFPGRCWLLAEPMAITFPLPCPRGLGSPAPVPSSGPSFYSEPLCCYYTHRPGACTLWDTEDSLLHKLELARAAGFLGWTAQKMPAD